MKIKVGKKQYAWAYNIRAMILAEQITGKPLELKSMTDWSVLVYACIMSANKDLAMTFETFIDEMDNDSFTKAISDISDKMKVEDQAIKETKGSKKK